jgi:hypothetical protein
MTGPMDVVRRGDGVTTAYPRQTIAILGEKINLQAHLMMQLRRYWLDWVPLDLDLWVKQRLLRLWMWVDRWMSR